MFPNDRLTKDFQLLGSLPHPSVLWHGVCDIPFIMDTIGILKPRTTLKGAAIMKKLVLVIALIALFGFVAEPLFGFVFSF